MTCTEAQADAPDFQNKTFQTLLITARYHGPRTGGWGPVVGDRCFKTPYWRPDVTSPVRRELHLVAHTGHQLRDEGQVGDLSGCPAELEDDDEGGKVYKLSPLRSVFATGQAGVENEGETHKNTNSSWKAEKEYF